GLPAKSLRINFPISTNSIDPKHSFVTQYQKQGSRDGWAHLQELILMHHITPESLEWIMELIMNAPGLQILKLSPYHGYRFSKFLERLASANNLPRIQELRLQDVMVTEECLSGLILRFHDSLRAFSFTKITIIGGGTWAEVFEEGGAWASVELVRFVVYADFIVELCAHKALLIYILDWRLQGETQWLGVHRSAPK
ncbi:hypothetical protein MMC14_009682, partial [Varicellaria rhodocarpa]|nr:hypothetical protein [Varicellaria rhodocarpa]